MSFTKLPPNATVRDVYGILKGIEWISPNNRGVLNPTRLVMRMNQVLMQAPVEKRDAVWVTVAEAFQRVAAFDKTLTAALGNEPFLQVTPRVIGVFNSVAKGLAPIMRDGPGVPMRDPKQVERYRTRLRAAQAHRYSIGVHHRTCNNKLDQLIVGPRHDIRSMFEEDAAEALAHGGAAQPVSREIPSDDPFWHVIEWPCSKCRVGARASLRSVVEAFLLCHEGSTSVKASEDVRLRLRKYQPPVRRYRPLAAPPQPPPGGVL